MFAQTLEQTATRRRCVTRVSYQNQVRHGPTHKAPATTKLGSNTSRPQHNSGEEGVVALADSLRANSRLQKLDLQARLSIVI